MWKCSEKLIFHRLFDWIHIRRQIPPLNDSNDTRGKSSSSPLSIWISVVRCSSNFSEKSRQFENLPFQIPSTARLCASRKISVIILCFFEMAIRTPNKTNTMELIYRHNSRDLWTELSLIYLNDSLEKEDLSLSDSITLWLMVMIMQNQSSPNSTTRLK